MLEHFRKQIEQGVKIYHYGLEREPYVISIIQHKDELNSLPRNLEYVRQLTNDWPLFREKE